MRFNDYFDFSTEFPTWIIAFVLRVWRAIG